MVISIICILALDSTWGCVLGVHFPLLIDTQVSSSYSGAYLALNPESVHPQENLLMFCCYDRFLNNVFADDMD